MVITQIKGGLGNQMFQYAIGRALSLKLNAQLLLDIRWYTDTNGNTPRTFELSHFANINGTPASKDEYKTYGYNILWKYVFRKIFSYPAHVVSVVMKNIVVPLLNSLKSHERVRLVCEKTMLFDEKILSLKGNIYLSGSWITEKYFKQIRDTILHDFAFPYFIKEAARVLSREIGESESIALHVRCGDYRKKYSDFFTMLDFQYYQHAVKSIVDRVEAGGDVKLFIFSDEPLRVREFLPLDQIGVPYVLVNVHNSDEAVHEIHLMSRCKHTVIANSTFSWWGAWLNTNPKKIIVCPKKWFAQEKMNAAHDYYPPEWILL